MTSTILQTLNGILRELPALALASEPADVLESFHTYVLCFIICICIYTNLIILSLLLININLFVLRIYILICDF